jgi:hypothetical protein
MSATTGDLATWSSALLLQSHEKCCRIAFFEVTPLGSGRQKIAVGYLKGWARPQGGPAAASG